jgi:hypothetical protein
MLHGEVLAIGVWVSWRGFVLLLVEVALSRERVAEPFVLTRRLPSAFGILVEGTLVPLMKELIMRLLIIGCELLSLPTLKPLPCLCIVLVYPF